MTSKLYQRFITLLAKYQVDPERKGRCLGELVRRNVSKAFPKAGNSVLENAKRWEENYKALEAIANNVDKKAFARTHISTASGLTVETASGVVTDYSKDSKQNAKEAEKQYIELKEVKKSQIPDQAN